MERRIGLKEQNKPVLANNLVGRLSSVGLSSAVSPLNHMSRNVGVFLPLNGNSEELVFVGEIRGV